MNIVLSGGGTAGHINPALALAEVLQDQGHTVLFAGTPQGVEARLVREAGIPFTAFEAAGFNRRHPATLIAGVRKIQRSTREAKKWFSEVKPDVVVGFGGYVSIPVARAAESLGIPVVIHEQNSVMGMANRYLATRAAAVALTYEVAAAALRDASKAVVTGNPVRRSVLTASREAGRALIEASDDALVLTVFGGSLGARHINSAICALKARLDAVDGLVVVLVTGPKELDTVEEALALSTEERERWKVYGYQNRMGDVLAASDLVVARAGASSLAEISALGVPALLVPFPYATGDHQTMNARACVDAGAALMVPDSELDTPAFSDALFELLGSEEARADMRERALSLKTADAADALARVVLNAAGKER